MKLISPLLLLSSFGFCLFSALATTQQSKKITLVDAGNTYHFKENQDVLYSAPAVAMKSFQIKLAQVKPMPLEKSGEILNPAAQFCALYLGKPYIWKDAKGSDYDVCKIGDQAFVTSWSAFKKWRSLQTP